MTVIASLKHAKIVNKNNNMGKFKLNFKSSKRKELQNNHKKKKNSMTKRIKNKFISNKSLLKLSTTQKIVR